VTPAEEAVLAAARAYRDAHARCLAVGLDPPDGIDMDAAGDALLTAASFLVDAPPAEAPTVAAVRPWPDPETYRALAHEVFGEVEWITIFFFVGLFMVVAGVEHAGLLGHLAQGLMGLTAGDPTVTALTILWSSAILSAIIDNIPYVATLTPIVSEMTGPGSGPLDPLWWALALGADLGGNATAIGASANVVIIGIAARNGHPISFWRFTRYGVLVAAVTLVIAWAYWALRYVVLA